MEEIDFTKITKSATVIRLLKQREEIEATIRHIDPRALVKYELERLSQ